MAERDTRDEPITTGGRMLSVMEVLEAEGGTGVTDVATRLDIAKSTAHDHLRTLQARKYVVKQDGEYRLGLRYLELGEAARAPWDEHTIIQEKVEELAKESQIRAQFLVPEHDEAVYVYRSTGPHSVPTNSRVGVRLPLHSVAAGKAILADFPAWRVKEMYEQDELVGRTEDTITDLTELQTALKRTRDRGYAVNNGESWEGVKAVGASVMEPDGSVLGGLSLSGAAHRVDTDEYGDLVKGAANEIELGLKYD